jgi:hypothetical protein
MFEEDDEFIWPGEPTAILIMGKRQGTKRENKQLLGRVAMAAALWYRSPYPKPYIMFVAADKAHELADAEVVKTLLTNQFMIPGDYLILREKTNCTLLEVRLIRVLSHIYKLTHIFAVTHLYHAPRAQRYFNEVVTHVSVIPVHPEVWQPLSELAEEMLFFNELQRIMRDSLPTPLDNLRETLIEIMLGYLHFFDRQGRVERWLARKIRN